MSCICNVIVVFRDNTVTVQPDMVEYDVDCEYMVKLVGAIAPTNLTIHTTSSALVPLAPIYRSKRNKGRRSGMYMAIKIEICCEMIPEKVHYLDLDGGVGFGGVNWWESIP